MLLAEALKERADLQTLVARLHERLDANARVQEGEKPTEDPRELLTKLDEALARLEYLMVHIKQNQRGEQGGGRDSHGFAGQAGLPETKNGHPAQLFKRSQRSDQPHVPG